MKYNSVIALIVFLILPLATLLVPTPQSTFAGYMLGLFVCALAISLRDTSDDRRR